MDAYEQVNASFGNFSKYTLQASTKALESTDDTRYNSIEDSITSLTTQRDALAGQIRQALNDAAFNGGSISNAQAQSWTNQANSLIEPGSGASQLVDARTSEGSSSRHWPGSSPSSVRPAYALRCRRCTGWPTASNMRLTWRFRPSWIVSSTMFGARQPRLRRRGAAVLELDAVRECVQRLLARLAVDLRDVDLLDAVARVRETVCERAVVRHDERAGRVGVEAADRDDVRLARDEVDDGLAALRVARGRDDAGGLVQEQVGEPLLRDRAAVDLDLVAALRRTCSAARARRSRGTRPALISSSALRREAMPARAR